MRPPWISTWPRTHICQGHRFLDTCTSTCFPPVLGNGETFANKRRQCSLGKGNMCTLTFKSKNFHSTLHFWQLYASTTLASALKLADPYKLAQRTLHRVHRANHDIAHWELYTAIRHNSSSARRGTDRALLDTPQVRAMHKCAPSLPEKYSVQCTESVQTLSRKYRCVALQHHGPGRSVRQPCLLGFAGA